MPWRVLRHSVELFGLHSGAKTVSNTVSAPAVKGYHACRLQDKNIRRFYVYTFTSLNTCQRTSMYQCFLAVKSHIPPPWDPNLTLSAGISGPWNDYFTGRHTFRRKKEKRKKNIWSCVLMNRGNFLPSVTELLTALSREASTGVMLISVACDGSGVTKGGSLLVTHDFRHWLAQQHEPTYRDIRDCILSNGTNRQKT